MIKKYNNEESDSKYKRLRKYLSDFEEREKDLLAKWKIYSNLTQHQMGELKSKWIKYYDDCRKTKVYELFRKQSEAFKINDLTTLKEISEEMTRIRENNEFEYTKPSSIDPDEMRMRLQPYWTVKDLLEGTEISEKSETKNIFGKKESESSLYEVAKDMFE